MSPAAAYVAMIPRLTEAARDVGYALAVHGSMGRDLDLVAIPWVEEAASAEQLILRLMAVFPYAHLTHRSEGVDGAQSNGDIPAIKPHDRLAWSIHFENQMYLDVSVMPRAPKPAAALDVVAKAAP